MDRVKLSMKRIRLESNLSRLEFANRCNVSLETVQKWDDNILMPDEDTLYLIEQLIISIKNKQLI